MKPIRGVMFDFGGVLYKMPDPRRIASWLRLLGIRDLGAMGMMNVSPRESALVMDIMTGRKPEKEVWESLSKSWGMRPGLINFLRRSGFSPRRLNRELLDFLVSLRPRLSTAILTNAGTDFRHTFCKVFDLENLAGQVIISAEEGIAKPDERLYQLAAKRLGIEPGEVAFIDDLTENVAGAQAAGMQALLHETNAQTIAWLNQLLNP